MSVSEQSDAAPPSFGMLAAIAAGAFACVLIGAVVVEPALHRVIEAVRLPATAPLFAPAARIEVADVDPTGVYRAEDPGVALDFEGAHITREGGGQLHTAPHRLVSAAQPASTTRTFARAMTVPPQAQIEVRRVVGENQSRLCGGKPVGWLALAIRRDGLVLMPVRQGPPPGGLAGDDRLCAVLDLKR